MLSLCRISWSCHNALKNSDRQILSSTMRVAFQPEAARKACYLRPACEYMHFRRKEVIILGKEYAGERKKEIFGLMMYVRPIPQQRQLPLHSPCVVGKKGDVTL